MQGDSSDEEDPLYALLGDLALRRLDQRLREDFGCFEPDDLLGISVADFGAIGLNVSINAGIRSQPKDGRGE